MGKKISSLVLPGLFILAWVLILTGSTPPGTTPQDTFNITALRWLLYFCGYAFISATIMHSIFAKKMAESIGWTTNGFQYEIAAVSLGLAISCLRWTPKSIPQSDLYKRYSPVNKSSNLNNHYRFS